MEYAVSAPPEVVPSTLCTTCSKLGFDDGFMVDTQHSPNCAMLKASAQNGCPLCLLLWHRLLRTAPEAVLLESDLTPIDVWTVPDAKNLKGFGLEARSTRPQHENRMLWVACRRSFISESRRQNLDNKNMASFSRVEYEHDLFGNLWLFGNPQLPTPPTKVDASEQHLSIGPWRAELTLVKQYEFGGRRLAECVKSHYRCALAARTALPTRLIDVGPADGLKDPRLHITTEAQQDRYFALSYCWGESQPLVTTTENIDDRILGIPISALPASIHDAVLITRSFHVRYLWVDALCIMQDSEMDWQLEAAKMNLTYQQATLTIAAGAARNSNDGIFRRRLGPEASPCTLSCSHTGNGSVGCSVGKVTVALPRPISEEPLDSRAWALQESLLSSRILYFGTNQLYFSCHEYMAFEDGEILRSLPGLAITYKTWHRLVDTYTARSLTYPRDKLPALSGLARYAYEREYSDPQSSLGGFAASEYVAGLWRRQLLQGLCWGRSWGLHLVSPFLRNPPCYRAPSWSWAALDGSLASNFVSDSDISAQISFSILEVETQLASPDPFGAVSNGRLVLCAEIRSACCGRQDVLPIRRTPNAEYSTPRKLKALPGVRELIFPELGPRRAGYCIFDTGVPDKEFWCLRTYKENKIVSGLLLALVFGRGNNVFKRIGIYRISPEEHEAVHYYQGLESGFGERNVTII